MDSNRDQLRDNLCDLLWYVHDWTNMLNHTTSEGNNLEAIHDTVHGLVGRGGHMGNVPMAGFDPIFFLHHANVSNLILSIPFVGAAEQYHSRLIAFWPSGKLSIL